MNRIIPFVVIFSGILIISVVQSMHSSRIMARDEVIPTLPVITGYVITPTVKTIQKIKPSLTDILNKELADKDGTYGIIVKDMLTGEMYSHGSSESFDTGSLYKLWVMGTVYDLIEKGKLSETDILSEDAVELNKSFRIATADAELKEGTVTSSVNDALDQMITVSDNYAALLLSKRIGLSNIAQYLLNNGFIRSKLGLSGGSPISTPAEIALYLEKLYNGELSGKYATDMIDLLRHQQKNNKIPKYLPDNLSVAHKTGEIGEFSHDAGIVYTSRGDYIIVIMTKTQDTDIADNEIGRISKIVYEYFQEY